MILPECRASAPARGHPVDILYEDDWLAVVNKPPGMQVHPPRALSGTPAKPLAHHMGITSSVGAHSARSFIAWTHTSGAILVAKNHETHVHLATQFERARSRKSISPWLPAFPTTIAT